MIKKSQSTFNWHLIFYWEFNLRKNLTLNYRMILRQQWRNWLYNKNELYMCLYFMIFPIILYQPLHLQIYFIFLLLISCPRISWVLQAQKARLFCFASNAWIAIYWHSPRNLKVYIYRECLTNYLCVAFSNEAERSGARQFWWEHRHIDETTNRAMGEGFCLPIHAMH